MRRDESSDGIEGLGRPFRPRLSRSRGEAPRLYIDRLNQAVARARAASGAKRNARPSGRFNARGRGAKIAPHLKGHGAWETDGGMRFRSRRVVVKARVVKLAGAGGKAAAAHLRYLQREGAGLDRDSERSPERAATFAYDANLKRVKEVRAGKTIYTIYSRVTGSLLHRDQATDAIKTEYASAGGASFRLKKTGTAAAVPEYLHADHLGTPIAATDATGAVTWRESYQPFGKALRIFGSAPANDNNTGFTGHLEDDASGLVYMQARHYDPLIGRFLSTDPIGYQDQLNLYAYVANDPVNSTDPTGEFCVPCAGAIVGAGIQLTAQAFDPNARAAYAAAGAALAKGDLAGAFEASKGNLAAVGKSAILGAAGGVIANGVSKGVIAFNAAEAAATGQTISKGLQVGNQIAADAIGGGVAGAATEAASQVAESGQVTSGTDVLKATRLGGAIGAGGSIASQATEAAVGAAGGQSSAATLAGGAASSAVDFAAGVCSEGGVKC